jgi:hypothetical protein
MRNKSLKVFHLSMYAGQRVTRADLGLPERWTVIEHWIDDSRDVVKNYADPVTPPTLKNSEIPVLQSYEKNAPCSFWSAFPKNYNKKVANTVNIKILKKLIQKCWFSWTLPQRMTAKRALRQLQGFSPVVLGGHSIPPPSKTSG